MHPDPNHRRPPSTAFGPRRRAAAVALVAVALIAASCGGDDSGTADSTVAPVTNAAATTTVAETTDAPTTTEAPAATEVGTTEAPATTATTTGAAFDQDAFCDATLAVEMAFASTGDPDADPVGVATAVLDPVMAAAALAPPELVDDFNGALDAIHTTIDTGDPSAIYAFDSHAIDEYGPANCGWTPIAVTAQDFHFTGMPETLPAGPYSFTLDNQGAQLHVLVIAARKPGITETWDELLDDPDAESKTVTLLGMGADPGETASGVTSLEPGEYLVLCPIPEGTVGETEGTGPPHFTLGMQQTLTVTP